MIGIKTNGSWKEVKKPFIKVNGKWQEIINGYAKVNGKWQVFLKYIVENKDTLLDVDLYKLFNSPKNPYHFVFINDGLIGCDESDQALLIDGFHENSKITIINNGEIVGKGGNGGYSNSQDSPTTQASDGTHALVLNNTSHIVNNGTIAGGGGGGAGASAWFQLAAGRATGGGGAGHLVGTTHNDAAINGTLDKGGDGNKFNYYVYAWVAGGKGGDLGQDGGLGSWGNSMGGDNGLIGKAGKAIVNNNTNSTLINSGELYGINDLDISDLSTI